MNTPIPLESANELELETGGGLLETQPPDRYSDYQGDGVLQIRWFDNNDHWSKTKEISLGKTGNTNIIRYLCPMGRYRSRQYEFIFSAPCHFLLSEIEEDTEISI